MKPLFFDAAWNYIEYPGQEVVRTVESGKKEEVVKMEQTPQQKKGWFGFGR